jgi:hypothetical protein
MPIQTSIAPQMPFGSVGDIMKSDSETIVRNMQSSGAGNNLGKAVTFVSDGICKVGGTGQFVGILSGGKSDIAYVTLGGTTTAIPDGQDGSIMIRGEIMIPIAAAANMTDPLKFNQTTGVISVGAAGAGETALPQCRFVENVPTGAGIAQIRLVY